ncbi:MAG: tRNA 4-thiouridine(8) synthase ThiI [Patescibacteria group bacterium]
MNTKRNKTKGLVLLSGGLDSILAIKVLQKQDIDVTGISFVSYFFNADLAKKAAKEIKANIKIVDFSIEHLNMVKNPSYGRGKTINPCIDCHLMMIRKAGDFLKKGEFDFIATGEVLGQRPMSQNKQALDLIKEKSGLKGYLLRPLSAKLLEPTILEEKGLINRNKLLDISGRSRKIQMSLAKKWGIKEYPSPAGGCILTDLQFSERLKELFDHWPDCQGNDIQLLRLGRHFWVGDNKIVIGRNKEENDKINKLKQKGDIVIEPKEFPGPTVLIRSKDKILEESLIKAKELIIKYSKKVKE